MPVSLGLIAIGGYGSFYVNTLLDKIPPDTFNIVCAADPAAGRCSRLAELKALGVAIYDQPEAMFARHQPELTLIASPIHLHCAHACLALAHGSHVLSEKPLCSTVQEAAQMIAARDAAGKSLGIGYQWSYTATTLDLKRDILAGRFGRPLRAKALTCWSRRHSYYARNRWAGALQTPDGQWVLDSPLNNATSHYLHQLLFLLGDRLDRSAEPTAVTAELYRANAITNFDTGAVRVQLHGGAEAMMWSTHAVEKNIGPIFVLEFEAGVVEFNGEHFIGKLPDGETIDYGDPNDDGSDKLRTMLAACRGDVCVPCPPEAARSQTLVINGLQECVSQIQVFPPERTEQMMVEGEPLTFVPGLFEAFRACYDSWQLPSEQGHDWSAAGRTIALTDYSRFPANGQLAYG